MECGALLGFSTVVLGQVATHVTSIDRHEGYSGPRADTERLFRRNVDRYLSQAQYTLVRGDAREHASRAGDVAFIDLTGEYALTRAVMEQVTCPVALVHDLHRVGCEGVARAIHDAGWRIVGMVDTLAVCERVGLTKP